MTALIWCEWISMNDVDEFVNVWLNNSNLCFYKNYLNDRI